MGCGAAGAAGFGEAANAGAAASAAAKARAPRRVSRNFIPRPFVFDATAEAAPRDREARWRASPLGKRALFPYSPTQSNIFFARLFLTVSLTLLAWASLAAPADADAPAPAIAMHGAPALAANFPNLPYANPQAPKGGTLRLGVLGTFDSLNPFNVKALSTAEGLVGHVFQHLMARSYDEPFTLYGLVAKSIETDAARDYATFRLDPRAHFSDGSPITADDVRFTFELLRDHGRPPQRTAFALVKSVTTPDAHTIRFDLTGANDRELPLILALMPVLSRAHTDAADFNEASLAIPVGSGPYVVDSVDPGRRIVYRRDPHYWGRDLPVSRGLDNFDRIEIDYYRDEFLAVHRLRGRALRFSYRGRRRALAARLRFSAPAPMARSSSNRRRSSCRAACPGSCSTPAARNSPMCACARRWPRCSILSGSTRRCSAAPTCATSVISAIARCRAPGGRRARASGRCSRPSPARCAPTFSPGAGARRSPTARGGTAPSPARRSRSWPARATRSRSGALRDIGGAPFGFEILVTTRAEERLALDYSAMLARIGVTAQVRLVDETQFQRRRQRFDFDMIPAGFPASASPGAEERGRWGSAAASQEGAFNVAGVRSPAVDAMISALLAATSEEDFVAAVRALDRLLLSGFYMVPFYHAKSLWIAYSSRLGHPARVPLYGVDLDAWWVKPR